MKFKTSIAIALLALILISQAVSPKVSTAVEVGTENSFALCHDGIDNDGNFLVDLSDPSCAPFVVVPTPTPTVPAAENTLALCTDGIDNNGNFLVDLSDPDCAPFVVVPSPTPSATPTPTPVIPSTGGGSPKVDPTPTPTPTPSVTAIGEVLGASTSTVPVMTTTAAPASCGAYLTTYLKLGGNNNPEEVKKLQQFLNDKLGLKLPVTGYFGQMTFNAVKMLQAKYKDAILKPWIDQKVVETLEPTGYVFKTTKWFINAEMCSSLGESVPTLK